MEPPHKKARIDSFSSQPGGDKAALAAAVAAKLSQTLLRVPQTRFPAVRPSDVTFLSFGEPETINVPAERVGQIIGKGGMKIREIQEKAQVKMAIAKDNLPDKPHLREIKLTGTKEGIDKCKKLLKELFDEVKIREGGTPDRTIEIPMNVVGLVIGKGGETVRKIIQDTNCIVQVEKNENFAATGRTAPKPGFQNVYLSGDPEALDKAEKVVRDLVAGAGNRRPPQNFPPYGAGFMPPYGMPNPYAPPYGMPPGPYGPGQNYAPPNPYNPAQMYNPAMYNPQSNPYAQGSQPYSPNGQPYNPQSQPYNPQAQPYNPQAQPYNPQAQPYSPGQVPYNPAQHAPPPGQNQAPQPGYGGAGPSASSGQTPYNPAQPIYYPPVGTYPPNQNNFAGQQGAQPNQIPGQMNGQQHQIPWQPNIKPNELPGQQNNELSKMGGQENSQLNQTSGQEATGQSSRQQGQLSSAQEGNPIQSQICG